MADIFELNGEKIVLLPLNGPIYQDLLPVNID